MGRKKVLVVAAHPDDEVLGCGGTIARLAQAGEEVTIAILGEGITSRYSERSEAPGDELEALLETCRMVAESLGARKIFSYAFPDNRFDTVPFLDIVKTVERVIDLIEPVTVFTHHIGDLNIDHQIVHRAVLTATRPVQGCPVREIFAFEVPSSTEWAFNTFPHTFHANVFMDISSTFEKKQTALELYTGEMRTFPHPRSHEALEANARRWGSFVGLNLAEAFQLVRMVL